MLQPSMDLSDGYSLAEVRAGLVSKPPYISMKFMWTAKNGKGILLVQYGIR